MKTKLVSLKAVDREWKRLIDWDVDPANLLAFGTDAVKKVVSTYQFRCKIALLTVENYKALEFPDDFGFMCQAAYNEKPDKPCLIKEVAQWTQKAFDGCDLEINLKCPKCQKVDCSCESMILEIPMDEMYKQANPQVHSYMNHYYNHGGIGDYGTKCYYHPQFTLMKAKTGYFDNINYHINSCINLNTDCDKAYEIKDGEDLIVNFKKGQVLISYLAWPYDDEGLIMVPDVPEVWEAIVYYIAERIAFSEFFVDPEQKNRIRWQLMVEQRAKKIGEARMRLRVPDPDDWESIVHNIWYKVMPYANLMENSYRTQGDQFHYPRT